MIGHDLDNKPGPCSIRKSPRRSGHAFTLIELLVVIALIVILASLIFPVNRPVRRGAPKKRAQMEEMQIAAAIQCYESECGKFPVSSSAMSVAANSGQDFTFGTSGLPHGLKTPGGNYDVRALDTDGKPLSYQANNSEVMAVLLDVEAWPTTPPVPTINQGHGMNPHKTRYLNAVRASDTVSAGVGSDGVYRDPWGQPYIITIDLNKDGKARDAFYRAPGISADQSDTNALKRGLDGLIATVVGGKTFYEASAVVMVWSAGPDKQVAPRPGTIGTAGANRDNVLSCR
ncbi:MAG: type II secretion system protein [Verrucomicrobiota bacterium]